MMSLYLIINSTKCSLSKFGLLYKGTNKFSTKSLLGMNKVCCLLLKKG